jgi:hypothetical protein
MYKKKYLVLLLGLLLLLGCSRKDREIPEAVLGHWTTNAAGYEGRYLQLEKDYVLVGFSDDDLPAIQRVSKVETGTEGRKVLYTIYSVDSDGTQQGLGLVYDPPTENLQIKNKPGIVWRRLLRGE